MTDIAPIKGLIELTDNFTSPIGLAEAALSNFSKQNQESLKAVAGAAGIVTVAIGAIAAATIELGKRGADVNDVNSTLEHFAGGAGAAKAAMDALREGTKGTVDNFVLAKDAAHLLSAGVQLTTQDFGTLGQAAFVLQNRGLGGTKEQLDLVSDALVTGRTRALSMALGVIDAGDAEENYAKKLGVTKDQLSESGKAEAKRVEVMRILNAAVKDAGTQERDFGEEFEFAQTQVVNFVDELGSAIASSKVFAAGFKAIETAVSGAFDGDKAKAIDTVVHFLEDGAIKIIDFAQAAITMAKVVEGAFELVKTIILGTETVIVGLIDGVVEDITAVAEAGGKLHIVDPETVAGLETTRTVLHGMTADLASQTIEAGKAVVGHTAFDETLDSLSTSLGDVRGAMSAAKVATTEQTAASDESAKSAQKNAAAQGEVNSKFIDQAKITAALVKSTNELNAIWDDYFKLVTTGSRTSAEAQQADIEATFNKQIAALDALDPLYNAKYAAYRKLADEATAQIGSDWQNLAKESTESLQQQADAALKDYNRMLDGSLHFTREALDAQKQKYQDLNDKARGWGDTHVKAAKESTDAMKQLGDAGVKAGDAILDSMGNVTKAVLLASGKIVALSDILKGFVSGTFDINGNPVNSITQDRYTGAQFASAAASIGNGVTAEQLKSAVTSGYGSLEELVADAKAAFAQAAQLLVANKKTPRQAIDKWIAEGGTVPGFEEGGIVMVGEKGPEAVRLPFGSEVYPTGTPANARGGGGNSLALTFNVNGTAVQAAQQIKNIILRELQSRRQFS